MVNNYPSIIDGEIYHFGIEGMKWHKRRYQNEDGSLTPAGKIRYAKKLEKVEDFKNKSIKSHTSATEYRVKSDAKRSGGMFGWGANEDKANKLAAKSNKLERQAAKQNYKAEHIVKRLNQVYGAIKVSDLDDVTLSRAKKYGIYLKDNKSKKSIDGADEDRKAVKAAKKAGLDQGDNWKVYRDAQRGDPEAQAVIKKWESEKR